MYQIDISFIHVVSGWKKPGPWCLSILLFRRMVKYWIFDYRVHRYHVGSAS